MVCVWVVALLVALAVVSSNLPSGSYFSWDWIGFYRIKRIGLIILIFIGNSLD